MNLHSQEMDSSMILVNNNLDIQYPTLANTLPYSLLTQCQISIPLSSTSGYTVKNVNINSIHTAANNLYMAIQVILTQESQESKKSIIYTGYFQSKGQLRVPLKSNQPNLTGYLILGQLPKDQFHYIASDKSVLQLDPACYTVFYADVHPTISYKFSNYIQAQYTIDNQLVISRISDPSLQLNNVIDPLDIAKLKVSGLLKSPKNEAGTQGPNAQNSSLQSSIFKDKLLIISNTELPPDWLKTYKPIRYYINNKQICIHIDSTDVAFRCSQRNS